MPRGSSASSRTCSTTAARRELDVANRADQERLRALHAERERTPLLPYRKALANRTPIEWREDDVPAPPFTGVRTVEPSLAELRDVIDWTFFFTAWELKGRYPQILDHPQHGEAARELFEHGNELLDTIVADGSIQARGVYGFWPAQADADDIVLDNGVVFPMLRQQVDHGEATAGPTAPSPTSSPRPTPGSPTTSEGSPSRRASARTSSRRRSRPTSTTTARSW